MQKTVLIILNAVSGKIVSSDDVGKVGLSAFMHQIDSLQFCPGVRSETADIPKTLLDDNRYHISIKYKGIQKLLYRLAR